MSTRIGVLYLIQIGVSRYQVKGVLRHYEKCVQ